MEKRIYLNNNWRFTGKFEDCMLASSFDTSKLDEVRLPHTVKETPLHYFDESEYQMISGYFKKLNVPKHYEGKVLLLTIEGAAHSSELFINGMKVASHNCGYTAYTADISSYVTYGEDNNIVVRVDSNESQNIPPFGFVIDYMTYGGIYRDVYLDVKEKSYIKDVFAYTKQAEIFDDDKGNLWCMQSQIISEVEIANENDGLKLIQFVERSGTNEELSNVKTVNLGNPIVKKDISNKEKAKLIANTGKVELWDIDNPTLYSVHTQLWADNTLMDEKVVKVGFRKATFKKDGFFLNGRRVKIRGLNRHQSFPYVGYAMPKSMQENDAVILKEQLGLNAVRTSHYPQSQYFIDKCDELGLMVFTEIPGWQHIGNDVWKEQAIENVKDMVCQYRNHPSIILWGVRINESPDDEKFYRMTNEIAKKYDSTRPTGGVRCIKNSQLFEDVYTYNDFVHRGNNQGCEKKRDITSDNDKAYLISEYMGHMFPTKSFDCEQHRAEHAIRHANVLNEVNRNVDIAGSFGWCMFDYNTHKDFGSGDRICYHGVMDMFRNPKFAAYVYACHNEDTPVLELSSTMDIGEHPECNRGETYIITNADSVRMYKNDHFIKEIKKEETTFKNLKHGILKIDDFVGDVLEKEEHMTPAQSKDVKAILNEVAKYGMSNLSKASMARAAKLMVGYNMKMDDAVKLYNKYIGDWGGKATVYRFEAIKDGQVVKTIVKAPWKKINFEVTASSTILKEENSYDVAAVNIKAVDEYGNVLPFFNEPLMLSTKGNIELIGPRLISLSGGMGGCYVKTTKNEGTQLGELCISSSYCEDKVIKFISQF